MVADDPESFADLDGHIFHSEFIPRSCMYDVYNCVDPSGLGGCGPVPMLCEGEQAQAQTQAQNDQKKDDPPPAQQQAQEKAQNTTSAAGVDFIKGWEGWNGKYDKESGKWLPKDDGFGNGTIGWGHNCGKCEDFKGGITKEQGDELLKKDLGQFEKAVNGLGAKLSQPQFDALVSFAFNVRSFAGSGLFANVASGTAVAKGNFTDYGHARKNGKLVEVPGLIKRRASEYNLYANGVYDSRH